MGLKEDLEILDNLDRLIYDKTVQVITVKEINELSFEGEVIKSKARGSRINVTLKTAIELIKNGYATLPDDYITWIRKAVWKENSVGNKNTLVRQGDDFYPKAILTIYALKNDRHLKIDDKTEEAILNHLRNIISKRLQIIMNEAYERIDHILPYTTPEESLIARIIYNSVTMWKDKMGIRDV